MSKTLGAWLGKLVVTGAFALWGIVAVVGCASLDGPPVVSVPECSELSGIQPDPHDPESPLPAPRRRELLCG